MKQSNKLKIMLVISVCVVVFLIFNYYNSPLPNKNYTNNITVSNIPDLTTVSNSNITDSEHTPNIEHVIIVAFENNGFNLNLPIVEAE